jgi:cysteine desulfurase
MAPPLKIYFDYAAATPVDPAVLRAMRPYFLAKFGNAGSLHSFGQEAMAALDRSREVIANSIGADFREIIFTGSATEADNLAVRGVLERSRIKTPKIIVSSIEHESVLETVRDLERSRSAEVVFLSVNRRGVIDLKELKNALDERVVLVSLIYANNEIGTVQPIMEAVNIIKNFRKKGPGLLFHTDAAQAFQFLNCDVAELGIDLMTLSSHKIYGPKGVGALYVHASDGNATLRPSFTGGGQEFGLRSGTENIPAIVGFAKAVELLASSRKLASKRIEELRKELWRGIKKTYPKAEINGVLSVDDSLPNILNVFFPGRHAQDLLTKFDLNGLAVSSGSACRARAAQSSYVIEALGHSKERAMSSIRFSLGRPTTKEEVVRALQIIKKAAG